MKTRVFTNRGFYPQTSAAGIGGNALGRLPAGVMNGTEAAYADELEYQKQHFLIQWWAFEAITFKLADDTRYTPDFAVLMADNHLEMREIKGFWREDAKIKLKVAAAKFPIQFVAVFKVLKKDGGGWRVEKF